MHTPSHTKEAQTFRTKVQTRTQSQHQELCSRIHTYFLTIVIRAGNSKLLSDCSIVDLGSNTGMGFLHVNDLQLRLKW